MNDEQLSQLVAHAAPIDDRVVDQMPVDDALHELMQEIMRTPSTPLVDGTPVVPLTRRRFRRWAVAVAGAAAAVVLAVAVIMWPRSDGTTPAFAAAAVEVAEANPRLLVDRDDWQVVRADEFAADQGEMTFSDGTHQLKVHWRPAVEYEEHLDDRSNGLEPVKVKILGMTGSMFPQSSPVDLTTVFQPQGINFLEIRANIGSVEAYRELLNSLVSVDVDTWLSALPASVVDGVERREVVSEMLQDIPLPEGYDTARWYTSTGVHDRYQVGVQVAGDVACTWIAHLHVADENGNVAGKQSAIDALQTADSWSVLLEMRSEGEYPEVLWNAADRAVQGDIDLSVVKAELGCEGGLFDSIKAAS